MACALSMCRAASGALAAAVLGNAAQVSADGGLLGASNGLRHGTPPSGRALGQKVGTGESKKPSARSVMHGR
jgi:hypothetical protein